MPRKAKSPEPKEIQEIKEEATMSLPQSATPKEKKKRNLNPDTMTYIKALALWKKESGKTGISPKKGSDEYDQVMKIFRDHQGKKE